MQSEGRVESFLARKGKLEQRVEDVEVLVIGSGIGGLAAAALLSKYRIKTYLAEKNEGVGGYFGSFISDNRLFDYAVSYALSLNENGVAYQLLKEVEVLDRLEIVRLKRLDKYIFDVGESYDMPNNIDDYVKYLTERFPAEKKGIYDFFMWLSEYYEVLESRKISAFIIKNFLKDFEPFIRTHIKDQRLINILSMRIQADPSSLFIMGGFINECLINGMYYVKGGYGELTLALAENICANGGRVGLGKQVCGIKYDFKSEKYKVRFANGETLEARYVISDISPQRLIDMWSDGQNEKQLVQLRTGVANRKIGHSSISVYLAVRNVDLSVWNCGRIYVIPDEPDNFDVFRYYEKIETGTYIKTPLLKVHIPSNYDKSICGEGESIIRVETDMCVDYFRQLSGAINGELLIEEEKTRILTYVLKKIDENINNDISKNIVCAQVLVPTDLEKIMGNEKGSGTGWAHTVENYFKKIFPTKTKISNLYIVGQWGELGSGLRQLVLTGRKAAEDIIEIDRRANDKG